MENFFFTTFQISKLVTKIYSTSFYTSSLLFDSKIRKHIFSIYGFVRFADEIVDTFHGYDKQKLIDNFEKDFYNAYNDGISLNPILNSFQQTVKEFNIPLEYVEAFLSSMKLDIQKNQCSSRDELNKYIYGSAEVVGLMCLKVFCNNNNELFESLKHSAIKLGAAFQKVNFLRDLKNDIQELGRVYYPQLINTQLNENIKNAIINDIENDFEEALKGIKQLPTNSKLAVYTAYLYYRVLLRKIKKTKAHVIMKKRIRVSNFTKTLLIIKAILQNKLNLI